MDGRRPEALFTHDMRNLLNGVVLNVSLLEDMASESVERGLAAEVVKRIAGYVARMDRLVVDLVDVVSLDAGKLELTSASCDVGALLTESVESCALAASDHGISIRCDTTDRGLHAVLDRERMLQVLGNLIANALRFTPRGGTIALRGERVAGELRLSVSDTGVGIPSDMLEAVFQRFRRVSENDHRGRGVGLYICKGIVESHGGRMWVESELGQGSTFHLAVPGARASRQGALADDDRAIDSP